MVENNIIILSLTSWMKSWNFKAFQRHDILTLMRCLKIVGILRFSES